MTEIPCRIFKLATQTEADGFHVSGRIASSLDQTDGFIHLSNRESAPVVAKLYFTAVTDLVLIELDAEKLPGACQWVVGVMGDAVPPMPQQAGDTTVHYLLPDGCVHVYGTDGVPTSAIIQQECVPYDAEKNEHVFPVWL